MSNQDLVAKLQRLIAALPEVVTEGLNDAAEQGAQMARTETFYTPRSSGSGLKEATQAEKVGPNHARIVANKYYASWVNDGRGEIFPVQAKMLVFQIDGVWIHTKHVKASQPFPFFSNMVKWEEDNYQKIVQRHIERLINQ
jgi:hypothetical protein